MIEVSEVFLLISKIAFIIFFFGFCIFIHEFGHLLVAMWRGLHIEKFSIGFGKPIFKFRRKNIDYLISWFPFGGYVALPQLDPSENPQTSDGKPLPAVKPMDRILTAVAGPLFNILFGFFLACFIWKIGIEGPAPSKSFTVGYVPETYQDSRGIEQSVPEFKAGIKAGDVITAINGQPFAKGWQEAMEIIIYSPKGIVNLDITRNNKPLQISYNLVPNPDFEGLGYPFMGPLLPTRVGNVLNDSPAMKAGLKKGDILLEINGIKVINPELLVKKIQELGSLPLSFLIGRNKATLTISGVKAELQPLEDGNKYKIGIHIESSPSDRVLYHPTPWAQFTEVLNRTYKTFRGLFDKKNPIKAKHMSGPVGIFHILYVIVKNAGFIAALNLIILISFSLAIMNLFPLPILDGGHILQGTIEGLFGQRIPYKLNLCLSYTFIVILFSFMMYVTYHDARRVGKHIYPNSSSQKNEMNEKTVNNENQPDASLIEPKNSELKSPDKN